MDSIFNSEDFAMAYVKDQVIMKVNNKTHIVSRLPSEKRVNGWIEEARTLSTIVTS